MLAFMVIGGVGIALLVLSLVAGEVFDGVLEGVGGDLLSGAAVAGFLAAFGFVGALTLDATGSSGVAIARQLALKQAEIKAETDAASARAAASGPLAQADRDQAILLEQEKVAVRQAALKERQLDTEVRKPADAERYRVEQEAEGRRNAEVFEADARRQASIAAAQAEAEKARLTGEGDKSRRSALAEAEAIEGARRGEAEKARRIAEAEALRAEGDAQAAAILATGQAEAEAMEKRAAAFAQYNEAAVLQMLVEVLPKVAREVAAPMSAIDKLTVVSTDGAGAMPKQVTNGVVQTMELLKNTTGVDLEELLRRYTDSAARTGGGGNGAGAGNRSASPREVVPASQAAATADGVSHTE